MEYQATVGNHEDPGTGNQVAGQANNPQITMFVTNVACNTIPIPFKVATMVTSATTMRITVVINNRILSSGGIRSHIRKSGRSSRGGDRGFSIP